MSISEAIITLYISNTRRFAKFLHLFCDTDKPVSENFLRKLRKRLKKNMKISQPLSDLAETPFTELPEWLFHDQSSTKYRQVKTVNGYSFDVVKSAMQKYARRGMPVDCMFVMAEMNFFKVLEGGKSSYTNFYNRIRVILLEDVGIASPAAIPIANKLLKSLRQTTNPFPVEVPQLAWLMSNSLHYRMYSLVRAFYWENRPDAEVPEEKFILGNDEVNFRADVDALVSCLERKDLACYWWMSQIVGSDKKLQDRRYRSNRPGFLGFAVLEWFFKKHDIAPLIMENFKVCLEWYKDLKVREASICPFHPMYLYVLEDRFDFDQETYLLQTDNPVRYWKPNLLNKHPTFISAVYDMHTRAGRTLGKNAADFAAEGSLVGFENMSIEAAVARETYVRSKLDAGIVWKETEVFTLKARAQLTCSQARPDVYFAKEEGKNIVVKGPYLDYATANKSFQVSRLLNLFEKVNTVSTNMRILIPDLFDNVPVGCRQQVENGVPYYFLVFEDLYDLDEYPTKSKSSKLWQEEKVVDFDVLFRDKTRGFAFPSEMTEDGKISLLYQLAIRYTFELGDFAARNFTRVGDKVWNLDTEGMFVGKSLRWKKTEREILVATYDKHIESVNAVLRGWLDPVATGNPSLYSRWFMVKQVMQLTRKQIKQARKNLRYLLRDYRGWMLS